MSKFSDVETIENSNKSDADGEFESESERIFWSIMSRLKLLTFIALMIKLMIKLW